MASEKSVQTVRDAMGRTIHVVVVADAAESLGYDFPPGSELMDLVRDERPEVVATEVDCLVQMLEKVNGVPLSALIDMARVVNPNIDFGEQTLRTLGRYLVMESLGSGVAWTDDHEGFGLKTPLYFEPGDSILVGMDDLGELPGFDREALVAAAEEEGNQRALDLLSNIPEQTQSVYVEGYEPSALNI